MSYSILLDVWGQVALVVLILQSHFQMTNPFTLSFWPFSLICQTLQNKPDQGEASHPLDYSARGEGRGVTPDDLTTNGPQRDPPAVLVV